MNIKKKIIPFIFFAYWVGIPGRWQGSSHCSSEKLLDPLWGKKGLWGLLWVVGVYKTPKNGHLNKWKNANKAPVMGPPMLTQVQFSGQVSSDSLQPHGLQPARLPCPQYCPSKNTGIGYHFLLQDTHRSLTEMPQQVSIDHFDLAGFLGKNTTLRVGSSTRITLHPPSLPRLP